MIIIDNKVENFKNNIEIIFNQTKIIYKDISNTNIHEFEEILTYFKDNNDITLTFSDSEEIFVDLFIRNVRENLLEKYIENDLSYSVAKQYISSHDYWDITFTFNSKYQFIEWYGC
jgi:hypothetical protein